ncbi:hypothetical protein FU659_31365 [Paenibacillus sp. N3.4]|nr:hypothetical protein FU659_31365 [Paenibacillus sp. N3.4]
MQGNLLRKVKRKLYLASLTLVLLFTGTACQSTPQVQDSPSSRQASATELPSTAIAARVSENSNGNENRIKEPIIVAEGILNTNVNGMKAMIRIWMTEGKELNDPEPGPFQGTILKGKFDAVATDPEGKELARFELNQGFNGEEMSFKKGPPFRLLFDDYNGDTQPDFTIGQWGGSNGNFYTILTIGPSGFGILDSNIYSADHRSSIRYRKIAPQAFLNKYYDQEKGTYIDQIHRWKDGAFLIEAPFTAKEVSAAGVDDASLSDDTSTWLSSNLETADGTLRASAKSAAGSIRIVSVGQETAERLGAPSCLGKEEDYRIQGSYKVIFQKTNQQEKLIASLNQLTLISPSMDAINMEKLLLDQVEIFTFYPQYQDCHGISFYLFGIDNQTGDAYSYSFVIDGKTQDSFYVKPGTKPIINNGQLIIMVSTGPGGEVSEDQYVFNTDLKNHRMELVEKRISSNK